MSEFKIEKGIPVPARGRKEGTSKYPFSNLEVGDSFFISCPNLARARQKSATLAYYNNKLAPKKFTLRAYDDGARIWRIA